MKPIFLLFIAITIFAVDIQVGARDGSTRGDILEAPARETDTAKHRGLDLGQRKIDQEAQTRPDGERKNEDRRHREIGRERKRGHKDRHETGRDKRSGSTDEMLRERSGGQDRKHSDGEHRDREKGLDPETRGSKREGDRGSESQLGERDRKISRVKKTRRRGGQRRGGGKGLSVRRREKGRSRNGGRMWRRRGIWRGSGRIGRKERERNRNGGRRARARSRHGRRRRKW